MRKTIWLLVAGCLTVVAGCGQKTEFRGQGSGVGSQTEDRIQKNLPLPQGANERGQNAFPAELAGTWEGVADNQTKWEITFKSDGTIESFKNYWNVLINVAEGGAAEELREGSVASYVLGPTNVEYDPNGRRLEVDIVTDDFYISLPMGEAEGMAQDVIKGVVSEDGTTWTGKWWNYNQIQGAEAVEPNKVEPQGIVFTKK